MLSSIARLVAGPADATGSVARRLALVVAVMGLAWSLLLAAIAFGLATLYLWMASWLAAPVAAALTAVAAAVTAAVGYQLALRWWARGGERSPTAELIRRHPMESVLLALTTGIVVSQSDPARAALANQLVAALARRSAP